MDLPLACPPASHVYLAVPSGTGRVTADTAQSLVEGCKWLGKAGIEVTTDFQCGGVYIDHVRNVLCRNFLRSDATDLIFVDDDLGFAPGSLLRLASKQLPFVGGTYRKKSDDVGWTHELDRQNYRYVDDMIPAMMIPTGFLRLNRAVLEYMIHQGAAPVYIDDQMQEWYRFFKSGVHERSGMLKYWGEDPDFCHRWRALKGSIYFIPDLIFAHVGMKSFTGSWSDYMKEHGTLPDGNTGLPQQYGFPPWIKFSHDPVPREEYTLTEYPDLGVDMTEYANG